MLLLDTLFPPGPAQLVADCRAMGASGCWVYIARFAQNGADLGIGGWTVAHVAALHAAGLLAPAVIVPGGVPGAVQPMLQVGVALGCDRIVAFDIESFSFASPQWLGAAVTAARALGWKTVRYGDESVLTGYPAADGDWISHGFIPVRTGSVQPVPALPHGLVADQYVVQVPGGYDASVCDPNFFGGDPMDPVLAAALQAFLGDYNNPDWGLRRVFYGATDSSGVFHPGLVVEEQDLETQAQQIEANIAKLSQPAVDASAVAAALTGNQAFLAALASAVAKHLGADLSQG